MNQQITPFDLVRYNLARPDNLKNFEKILTSDMGNKPLQHFMRVVFRHWERDNKLPSLNQAIRWAHKHWLNMEPEDAEAMMRRLYDHEEISDFDAETFAGAMLLNRLSSVRDDLQLKLSLRDSTNVVDVWEEIENVEKDLGRMKGLLQVGNRHNPLDDIWHPISLEELRDVDLFKQEIKDLRGVSISTGFEFWDSADFLGGGNDLGEMVLVIGAAGSGKTALMSHTNWEEVRNGHRTLSVALDDSRNQLKSRWMGHLAGRNLRSATDLEIEEAHALINLKMSTVDPTLFNVINPRSRFSFKELAAICDEIEVKHGGYRGPDKSKGRLPRAGLQVIRLDYIDVVDPRERKRDSWDNLDAVTRECAEFLRDYNYLGWVTTHAAKAGYRAEITGPENVAGAFAKIKHPSQVVCLCQTEEEIVDSRLRGYVPKARRPAMDYLVPFEFNRATGTFRETGRPYYRGSQQAREERQVRVNLKKQNQDVEGVKEKKQKEHEEKMRSKALPNPRKGSF